CQQCLQQGNCKSAAQAMKRASDQLKQMSGESKELKELSETLQDLQDAKKSVCQGCDNPVPASGKRPEAKEGATKSVDKQVPLDYDPKGKNEVIGTLQGGGFKKKSSQEMAGSVTQAAQDAAEASEQQPVDRASKDMYKGYFENLRKDAEKEQKKNP